MAPVYMSRSHLDHPRIRGEHHRPGQGPRPQEGSSPHTRGARGRRQGSGAHPGIIPAYAGSTRGGSGRAGRRRDHPRIRGEHAVPTFTGGTGRGSSPHTRGALHPSRRHRPRSRIIPAYAGSTSPPEPRPGPPPDHPRIRGEHQTRQWQNGRTLGSSPHTRGALLRSACACLSSGIIPAYAGSTTSPPHTAEPDSDHPRIRGEHPTTTSPWPWRSGSSPHTRGAHLDRPRTGRRTRIIPAYAGSTSPG